MRYLLRLSALIQLCSSSICLSVNHKKNFDFPNVKHFQPCETSQEKSSEPCE